MVIAKRFLAFVETAPWPARVAATTLLAQAYIKQSIPEDEIASVEAAMTAMLDDNAPMVRRALAEVLAPHSNAPRHLIVALAGDVVDVSCIVLEQSPLLTTAELIESVVQGGPENHAALVQRQGLTAPVCAALAEVVSAESAIQLVQNETAEILSFSLETLITRHETRDDLVQAISKRAELPRDVQLLCAIRQTRNMLAVADTATGIYVRGESNLQDRLEGEILKLASECSEVELQAFVRSLRRFSMLNSSLVLRAILLGHGLFAAAVFSELAGFEFGRSKVVLSEGRGGFSALFQKAGLPRSLLPVFVAAMTERPYRTSAGKPLDRDTLRKTLVACVEAGVTEADAVVGMLRRLDSALARIEARAMRHQIVTDAFLDAPVNLRPSLHENDRIQMIADGVADQTVKALEDELFTLERQVA